ncbi:unnamed protein product [Amoebophrya sp. A120]|nr:unnamed protein product [Amoebophrya sp. A120]|eukprot:GSA120T00013713001.1
MTLHRATGAPTVSPVLLSTRTTTQKLVLLALHALLDGDPISPGPRREPLLFVAARTSLQHVQSSTSATTSSAEQQDTYCPDCAPYNLLRILDPDTGRGTGWYDSAVVKADQWDVSAAGWEECGVIANGHEHDHEKCAKLATMQVMRKCQLTGCHAVMRKKVGSELETTEVLWSGESSTWGGPKTKTETLGGPDESTWLAQMAPPGWAEAGLSHLQELPLLPQLQTASDEGKIIISLTCQKRPCQFKNTGNGWRQHSETGLCGEEGAAVTNSADFEQSHDAHFSVVAKSLLLGECRESACCAGVVEQGENGVCKDAAATDTETTSGKNGGQTPMRPLREYTVAADIVSVKADALAKPPVNCVGSWLN